MNRWDPGKATERKEQNKVTLPGPQFPHLENEWGSQSALQLEEPMILTSHPISLGC